MTQAQRLAHCALLVGLPFGVIGLGDAVHVGVAMGVAGVLPMLGLSFLVSAGGVYRGWSCQRAWEDRKRRCDLQCAVFKGDGAG